MNLVGKARQGRQVGDLFRIQYNTRVILKSGVGLNSQSPSLADIHISPQTCMYDSYSLPAGHVGVHAMASCHLFLMHTSPSSN